MAGVNITTVENEGDKRRAHGAVGLIAARKDILLAAREHFQGVQEVDGLLR